MVVGASGAGREMIRGGEFSCGMLVTVLGQLEDG